MQQKLRTGFPTRTQSSSHQQHVLHPLTSTDVQTAALGESNQRHYGSDRAPPPELCIEVEPKHTWLQVDPSHHSEEQVKESLSSFGKKENARELEQTHYVLVYVWLDEPFKSVFLNVQVFSKWIPKGFERVLCRRLSRFMQFFQLHFILWITSSSVRIMID